jgi:hypothetical protein
MACNVLSSKCRAQSRLHLTLLSSLSIISKRVDSARVLRATGSAQLDREFYFILEGSVELSHKGTTVLLRAKVCGSRMVVNNQGTWCVRPIKLNCGVWWHLKRVGKIHYRQKKGNTVTAFWHSHRFIQGSKLASEREEKFPESNR